MQIPIEKEFDAALDVVARVCGYTWGKGGNVKELVRAIARGERFPIPVQSSGAESLEECDRLIAAKQPFSLLYRDSQGVLKEWQVHYGEIQFYEKRLYLDAWCEETQASDLPELAHNVCFRGDRILEVTPIDAEWRKQGLDTAIVQLAFYNGMIRAYEKRSTDVQVELEDDRLIVDRRITNSFWFVRSILPYGADCEVLNPPLLRKQVAEQFSKAAKRYQEEV